MKIEIHIHHHDESGEILRTLHSIERKMTMNQAELATALGAIGDSLGSVGDELAKATAEIIAAVANSGNTTPEVDAAVARLQGVATALATAAQTLDDLNPDQAPTPAP